LKKWALVSCSKQKFQVSFFSLYHRKSLKCNSRTGVLKKKAYMRPVLRHILLNPMKSRKRKKLASNLSASTRATLKKESPTNGTSVSRVTGSDSGSKEDILEVVKSVQNLLDASSSAKYRDWIENYVKGPKFRGVKMPGIREVVKTTIKSEEFDHVFNDTEKSFDLAMTLLKQEMSEDRLAGTLIIADHIIPSGHLDKAGR